LLMVYGSATLVNSTIAGNTAAGGVYVGGAIHAQPAMNSSLKLIDTTISSNNLAAAALVGTGGLLVNRPFGWGSASASFVAYNSITSGNTSSPTAADIVLGPNVTHTTGFNLFGAALGSGTGFNDGVNNTNNVFSDTPGLGPLQNNGGPTQTMALLVGSLALNAGSDALAIYNGQPINYDQRGLPRSFGTVDIGAFEDQGGRIFANGFEPPP